MDHLSPLSLLGAKGRRLFWRDFKLLRKDLQLPVRLLVFMALLALELGQLPFGCPALLGPFAPLLTMPILFRALVCEDPLLNPEDTCANKGGL